MEKLRVGIVGMHRGLHLMSNLLDNPNVIIGAVCDANDQRLQRGVDLVRTKQPNAPCAAYRRFEELLGAPVDALLIATDAALHVDMSIQAIQAGKHVLSEVPAIHSLEEAQALYRAVKQSDRMYMLAENCCFWAFIEAWRNMHRSGRLGDIWYAEAEYLHNVAALMRDAAGNPTWRASYHAIRYLTHDLGPLLYIMDDACVTATGFIPEINPISDYSTGQPNGLGVFKTRKGAMIRIFIGLGITREPSRHNFSLYGSKGTLYTTQNGPMATLAYFSDLPQTDELIRMPLGTGYPGYGESGHGGADRVMLDRFVQAVLQGQPSPVPVEMAIRMSLPGVYADLSANQGGKPIDIPDPDDFLKAIE